MLYLSLVVIVVGVLVVVLSIVTSKDGSKKNNFQSNSSGDDFAPLDKTDYQKYTEPALSKVTSRQQKSSFDNSDDLSFSESLSENETAGDDVSGFRSHPEFDSVEECDEVEYFTWEDDLGGNIEEEVDLSLDDISVDTDDEFGKDVADDDNSEGVVSDDSTKQIVLFEDYSTVIDYDTNNSSIDSTLNEYENIRRIGSGTFVSINDGISFYVGKKLYRFDFHNLLDVKHGDNFLALFYGMGKAVKLFISIDSSILFKEVYDDYLKYVKE